MSHELDTQYLEALNLRYGGFCGVCGCARLPLAPGYPEDEELCECESRFKKQEYKP